VLKKTLNRITSKITASWSAAAAGCNIKRPEEVALTGDIRFCSRNRKALTSVLIFVIHNEPNARSEAEDVIRGCVLTVIVNLKGRSGRCLAREANGKKKYIYIYIRHYATNRKVAGSIPDEVNF
jgi:hypothetical protein